MQNDKNYLQMAREGVTEDDLEIETFEGANLQEVIDAAIQSHQRGRWVSLS